VQAGDCRDRVADAVLCHTLDGAVVVAGSLDRLDAQQGPAERHRHDGVALAADGDTAPGALPVHVRYRVTAGSAHEAGDAAVDDALISRQLSQPRSICRALQQQLEWHSAESISIPPQTPNSAV